MNVKLIGFTPNPEKIPAMAAKLTHSKTKPEDLDKTSDKELKAILEQVTSLGHTSVIEHTNFTFAISDVSRSLTHQLVRHRIASYAQQSQRYVDFKEPNYVTPPKIAKNKQMKKAYDDTMKTIWEQYSNLLDMGIMAMIRVIRGPTAPDRIVGLDTINTIVISGMVIFGAAFNEVIYIDVAIVYALLSFITTLFIAKYLEGGDF